jgi:hypothetical protein
LLTKAETACHNSVSRELWDLILRQRHNGNYQERKIHDALRRSVKAPCREIEDRRAKRMRAPSVGFADCHHRAN